MTDKVLTKEEIIEILKLLQESAETADMTISEAYLFMPGEEEPEILIDNKTKDQIN